MKKTILIFLVLLTLIACTGQLPGARQEVQQFLKYDAPQFSINYPSDWTVKTQGAVVGFISPKESAADAFMENVNVIVQPIQKEVTLKQYVDENLAYLNKALAGKFSVDLNEAAIVSGESAAKLVYTAAAQGRTVKAMQVFSKKGNTFFVITYTALPESYESHLAAAEEMINSFKMK